MKAGFGGMEDRWHGVGCRLEVLERSLACARCMCTCNELCVDAICYIVTLARENNSSSFRFNIRLYVSGHKRTARTG